MYDVHIQPSQVNSQWDDNKARTDPPRGPSWRGRECGRERHHITVNSAHSPLLIQIHPPAPHTAPPRLICCPVLVV